MPENLNDKYQVFLQAAQVINQQAALQQRAEQEDARLRLKEQYQNELFESKAAALKAKEEQFNATMALKQAQQQVAEMNAQTNRDRADTYAESVKSRAKSGGADYYKNLQAKKLELDISEKLVKNHEEAIKNFARGPTGDPVLDGTDKDGGTMLLRMTPEELEKEYKRVQGGVLSGDRNVLNQLMASQPGMDINASSNLYLRRLAGIAQYRDEQKNKYLDGVLKTHPDDKAAQFLRGRNFVLELETPRQGEGAVQKAQGDQEKANAGQLPPGAGPGAVTNPGGPPPSPEAKQVLETIDTYTAELLSTPEGVTSAASYIAEQYRTLRARNDPSAALLYQKVLSRSPALAAKAVELIKAGNKKK